MVYIRKLKYKIEAALLDSPILLLHGPRQCGKTTLAQLVAKEHGHQYVTLDDPALLAAAKEDPIGFIKRLESQVVLDEIQRAPELFLPIKMSVDANRLPGRFILTGSANLLRMPDLPDSLAGRIEIMRLGPLTQLEMSQCVEGTTLLERIFQPEKLKAARVDRLGEDLIDRVLAGGFPAAVARTSHARRALWLRNYIETLVEKDIRELFSMQRPDVIFPLLESAAGRTARLYTGTTTHIQILTCHKIACRAAKKQESMVHILNRAESANGCSTGESRFLLTAFVNDSPEIISQYRTG